jgi:hypothetical protein
MEQNLNEQHLIATENARLYAERTEKIKGKTAFDFCRDHEAACIYLDRRPENKDGMMAIEVFTKTLEWKFRTAYTLSADIPNGVIVHELAPGRMHSFPIWGEMFYQDHSGDWQEPELFDSLECFVAFMMARFW